MKRFLALTTLLILTACTAATVEPVTSTIVPSDTPPPTASPTIPPTPTGVPTSTSTPTLTPLPPTLEPAIWDIEHDYLDSEPTFPGCELPCWQGLKLGESTQDNVQMTLTSLTASAESIFSAYYRGQSENTFLHLSYEFYFQDDLDLQTYDWESWNDSFEVGAVVDRQDTLQALFFHLSNDDNELPYSYHTVQHILNRFGEPAGMYFFAIEAVQVGFIGRLLIVYESGMSFFLIFKMFEEYDENAPEHNIELCLDDVPTSEKILFFNQHNEEMNSIGEAIITEYILSSKLVDVEEYNVFGLTISEISILARTEEKVCLRLRENQ